MFLGQCDSRLGHLARGFGLAQRETQAASSDRLRCAEAEGVLELMSASQRLLVDLERRSSQRLLN